MRSVNQPQVTLMRAFDCKDYPPHKASRGCGPHRFQLRVRVNPIETMSPIAPWASGLGVLIQGWKFANLAHPLAQDILESKLYQQNQIIISRRAGLKIRFRKECRFDPDRPHHPASPYGLWESLLRRIYGRLFVSRVTAPGPP